MYKYIQQYISAYGSAGVEDARAIKDYMECENRETVSALRSEIYGLMVGKHRDETLDKLLGSNRKSKHGSFQVWAKYMLQWMADFKG